MIRLTYIMRPTGAPVGRMMYVSLIMALVISIGKIAISLLSAFAVVYFRFPGDVYKRQGSASRAAAPAPRAAAEPPSAIASVRVRSLSIRGR